MYFIFTIITGFTGLVLATVIRIELAYAGQGILNGNSEKYLTVAALHAIVMVFFMIIPILFGAFGNFLLPTQLGIRDVAFPRLNSFMFWVTPAGFVMLLHVLLFDKSYNLTYWLNYSELKSFLRRRYQDTSRSAVDYRLHPSSSLLANRLATPSRGSLDLSGYVLQEHAPQLQTADSAQAAGLPGTGTFGALSSLVLHAGRSACTSAASYPFGRNLLLDVYGAACSLRPCVAQVAFSTGITWLPTLGHLLAPLLRPFAELTAWGQQPVGLQDPTVRIRDAVDFFLSAWRLDNLLYCYLAEVVSDGFGLGGAGKLTPGLELPLVSPSGLLEYAQYHLSLDCHTPLGFLCAQLASAVSVVEAPAPAATLDAAGA